MHCFDQAQPTGVAPDRLEHFRRGRATPAPHTRQPLLARFAEPPVGHRPASPPSAGEVGSNVRSLIGRAGLPTHTFHAGKSPNTFDRAPTTVPAPIVTPGPTNTSVAIQASSPTVIGGRSSGLSARV